MDSTVEHKSSKKDNIIYFTLTDFFSPKEKCKKNQGKLSVQNFFVYFLASFYLHSKKIHEILPNYAKYAGNLQNMLFVQNMHFAY